MKSGVGPKLVPFFKTVAIYFVLFIPADQPSILSAIIKALPIISLVFFVLLNGMSFGMEYSYSRRILLGLIFSIIGDVLLVWDHFFLHGLLAFLAAQVFYISAFGFQPLNWKAGSVIYSIAAAALAVMLPNINGPLKAGVLVYTLMLSTMTWRAVSRVQIFEELWTWTKLFSCVGSILFTFSDGLLGLHNFYTPIPYSQLIIMTTYYAAQLGIALSIVDCKASYLDSLSSASRLSLPPNIRGPLPPTAASFNEASLPSNSGCELLMNGEGSNYLACHSLAKNNLEKNSMTGSQQRSRVADDGEVVH